MREWLKELRWKRNMTQTDVASTAGISTAMYCYIESGQRRPSPETARAIARVLGFKAWYALLDPMENACSETACEAV